MNYKEAAICIAFLTIIMTSGVCPGTINTNDKNKKNKIKTEQKKILEAIEKNDYAAWKASVIQNAELLNAVKEREFSRFVEARNAARKGLYDRSIAISTALEMELRGKINYVFSIA